MKELMSRMVTDAKFSRWEKARKSAKSLLAGMAAGVPPPDGYTAKEAKAACRRVLSDDD